MKTRLENVIEQVKNARIGEYKPWIFDDNGNVKDNIMCCEVLDLLEELKDYEVSVSDKWIDEFLSNPETEGSNTYNWGGCISNDLNMDTLNISNGEQIRLIMVHLYGDICGGYSDYFVVKFDNEYEFYELESTRQSKGVNDHMVADLNIFSDTYNVYDYEKQDDIGSFYELELEDLLEEIKNID